MGSPDRRSLSAWEDEQTEVDRAQHHAGAYDKEEALSHRRQKQDEKVKHEHVAAEYAFVPESQGDPRNVETDHDSHAYRAHQAMLRKLRDDHVG